MKNFKDQLKIIVTAVVCFLMNIFPKKNGKCFERKNLKTKDQTAKKNLAEGIPSESIACKENKICKEHVKCKDNMRKINVIPKYKVYWHIFFSEIRGNSMGYYASG